MPSFRVTKPNTFGYRIGQIIVVPKEEALGVLSHFVEPVVITPVHTKDVFRVMAGPKTITPSTLPKEIAPTTLASAPLAQDEIKLPKLPTVTPTIEKKDVPKTTPPKPKE